MQRSSYMECHYQNLIYSNNLVVLLTPEGLNMNNPRF